MTFRVVCYEHGDAFAELEKPWRALAERANGVSVFLTWEWQSIWWQYYGSDKRLRLLAVWDATDDLVALLPYYIVPTRTFRFVPTQEARLIGTGGSTSPDYMGALVHSRVEEEATAALIEAFIQRRKEWDTLRFMDVREGPFVNKLQRALSATVRFAEVEVAEVIRIARLPASWDDYLASLDGDRRKRVRYQRRNAEKKIAATMHVCKNGDELQSAFESLVRLHRKRWSERGENEGAFRTPTYVEFHRTAIEKCRQRDWIRLYRLDSGSETAAVLYCYRYGDELLHFQSGFDPQMDKFSVGQTLIGYAFEAAIGEGLKVFDMLKGDHAYKRSWSNDTRRTYLIAAWRATPAGLLSWGRQRLSKLRRGSSGPAHNTGGDGNNEPLPDQSEAG